MIKQVYYQGQAIKQAYLNGQPLLKNMPRISADFVTGNVIKDGKPSTFAEVFTFNRAGKAWLVLDTGLQEYLVDTPRFDNGLLIEEQATNIVSNINYWTIPSSIEVIPLEKDWNVKFSQASLMFSFFDYQNNSDYVFSVYTKTDSLESIFLSHNGKGKTVNVSKELLRVNYDFVSANVPRKGIGIEAVKGNLFLRNPQLEKGSYQTSPIPTINLPVTRPADYLSLMNIVDAKSVTGDWDSTLKLTIVNGQLNHSGYGKIRSMEVW